MGKIPLASLLKQLRHDLLEAQQEGANTALRLGIDDIELELQISATEDKEGKVGTALWVFTADAGVDLGKAQTHTLRIKLKAFGADGKPLSVSGIDTIP